MTGSPVSSHDSESRTSSGSYLQRWRRLSRPARLYLIHAALLTSGLAISGLFFNLLVLALGYPRDFLGWLNMSSIAVAALLSLPLWWLVTRIGLRRSLIANAVLQTTSAFLIAAWPAAMPLLIAVALTGAAATIFQVSAPPFMMHHSDDASRDHLFSANAAINVGLAGVGSLLGGSLPARFAPLLGVGAESPLAYRATFAVSGMILVLSLLPLLLMPNGVSRRGDPAPAAPQRERAGWAHILRGGLNGRLLRLLLGTFRASGRASLAAGLPEPWRGLLRHRGLVARFLVPPLFISWGAALLIQYLNLFFKERFAIADDVLGLIFAALGLVTGLSALLGPALSARLGKPGTIVLTQALSIPFLLVAGFSPLLYVAVGAALARAALFNMGAPLYDAFAMEHTDEAARPIVIGLINGAYTVGYLFAPLISTRVQEQYGFGPIFVATAICYGLAAFANYWFFIRTGRQRYLLPGGDVSAG